MRTRNNTVIITGADLSPTHEIEVVVQAVSTDGRLQSPDDSPRAVIVIKGKETTPSQPSGLTALGGIAKISLFWDAQTDKDFDVMEIWVCTTDNLSLATKFETKATSWTDNIGSTGQTRYYWLRARNTSGKTSLYYPETNGVSATTSGVNATDIADFAVTATKTFANTIILTGDAWTNNSPVAGSIAWNTHYLVYNGAYYRVTGSFTDFRYVYWTMGHTSGSGTVANPYITTYNKTSIYAYASATFVIATNESGVAQLVWNSSANMVIGSAFIMDAAIVEAKIDDLAVTNAKIDTLTVSKLTAGTINSQSIVLGITGGEGDVEIRAGIATGDFANAGAASGFIIGLDDSDFDKAKLYIGDATHYMKWDGAALTVNGSDIANSVITDIQTGSEIAIQGWQSTIIFSAGNYQLVSWAAGTIKLLDGTSYAINLGNTGNMAAGLYYIYLDIAVSTIALQKTQTAATAVGTGKILIAVAQRNADTTSRATFQVFGGSGGNTLLVDNIAANSASVNEFVSNTAQIANLIVTDAKINTLAVSKLTAGTITSQTITLATAASVDCYINAGKTAWDNTQAGFILGLDNTTAKFFIGDTTKFLNWDGAALTVQGILQTAASGQRVILDPSDGTFKFYNGSDTKTVELKTSGTNPYMLFGDQAGHDIILMLNTSISLYNDTEGAAILLGYYWNGAADDNTWQLSNTGNLNLITGAYATGGNITCRSVSTLGNINATGVFKVATVQVVGAQGAAVANATDAASVILRLNDLLARCRAHGLIATA